MWITSAHSIVAFIAPFFSLVPSMSLMPTESPFIIVLIMEKYSKDTSSPIQDIGILSVHCSPCSTLSTLL